MIEDLGRRLEGWLEHRRAADRDGAGRYVGRHKTQLQAVGSLLTGSSEVLELELASIAESVEAGSEAGEVFERTRHVADAAVWLERVWRYFGRRFDQRDGENARAGLVTAADEVVWSCYRLAYEHPRLQGQPRRPPPLAYVEAEYSPAARMAGGELERRLEPAAVIRALDRVAGDLPIPLLRLPPWCVGAPWWLVFVAHEVGHHLQHELELVEPFRAAVEEVAEAAGAGGRDKARWGRWGEEIFADFWSILLMGPWALWALVEVERGPAATMARRRVSYPPSLVRLRILAGVLARLGLPAEEALRGVDLEAPPGAPESFGLDLAIGDGVVELVERRWPLAGRLAQLSRFRASDFQAGGEVERWASRLRGDGALDPPSHLDSARRLTAAAVCAWARLGAETPPGELRAAAQRLAGRVEDAIRASSPPGTRSALMPSGAVPELGRSLGSELLTLARAAGEEQGEEQREEERGGED